MLNVYVIGCGGIGGYLIDKLPMCLASLSLDLLENAEGQQKALELAGSVSIPCVADRLTLVDGDTFNPRNAVRQGDGGGSKLIQRMRHFKEDSVLMAGYLQRLQLVGYNEYVTPNNIGQIIPVRPAPNLLNKVSAEALQNLPHLKFGTVVFLCVDNLKTRYEVSKYMERFTDCIVFNGGNDKTSGHVTIYERAGGVELDPPIYEVYPNVRPDADKRPDEIACGTVAPKHDQLAVTNSMVADVMLGQFIRWARKGQLTVEGKPGVSVRYNEILLEIETPSLMPVCHKHKTNKETNNG